MARLPVYRSGSIKRAESVLWEETQFGEFGQGDNLLGPAAAGVALNRIQTYNDRCFENKFFIIPVKSQWGLMCI